MKTIKHFNCIKFISSKTLKYLSSSILKPEIPTCLCPQIKTQIKKNDARTYMEVGLIIKFLQKFR